MDFEWEACGDCWGPESENCISEGHVLSRISRGVWKAKAPASHNSCASQERSEGCFLLRFTRMHPRGQKWQCSYGLLALSRAQPARLSGMVRFWNGWFRQDRKLEPLTEINKFELKNENKNSISGLLHCTDAKEMTLFKILCRSTETIFLAAQPWQVAQPPTCIYSCGCPGITYNYISNGRH